MAVQATSIEKLGWTGACGDISGTSVTRANVPTCLPLAAHPRWPVKQTAPLAERRPVDDSAALTPPRQMPAA